MDLQAGKRKAELSDEALIGEFLNIFYRTISFEAGEEFHSEAFRKLFLKEASLLEKDEN